MKKKGIGLVILVMSIIGCNVPEEPDNLQWLDQYNVIWTSQSENSSASMPVSGEDIGLNVWVENSELFMYLARAGYWDENGALLKPGRVLPAWPAEWDVNFKLHAPFQTVVEGELYQGEFTHLAVSPESREKDLEINANFSQR